MEKWNNLFILASLKILRLKVAVSMVLALKRICQRSKLRRSNFFTILFLWKQLDV